MCLSERVTCLVVMDCCNCSCHDSIIILMNLCNLVIDRVDTDADGLMSLPEMEHWIQVKIRQHFAEALEENTHIFKHMDPDGDGMNNIQ